MSETSCSCDWCGQEFDDADAVARVQSGEADVSVDGVRYSLAFDAGELVLHHRVCLAEWAQKYAEVTPYTVTGD